MSLIPHQLVSTPQWILWKQEVRDGKATKVPCDAFGRPASVNDPKSWYQYHEAAQLASETDLAGIGFCFTAADPFVGIDLDDCLPTLRGDALEILRRFPTYAEVSPSGMGIKLIGLGDKGDVKKARTGEVTGMKQMEVYDRDRFFTVTGNQFGVWDVADVQESLDWLIATFLTPEAGELSVSVSRALAPAPEGSLRSAARGFQGTDAQALEVMFHFNTNGTLRTLYEDGDQDGDASRADAKLLEGIAWIVGPDPERIERIFDSSALGQRDKWLGRPDYRRRSIDFVIGNQQDHYRGGPLGSSQPRAVDSEDHPAPREERTLSAFPIPDRGIIRDVVDLVGPYTESPDSTLALGTLVVLSAVAGWSRVIEWGESDEPCILYACICGPTAVGRKTTGMNSVVSIFREVFDDEELRMESGGHVSGRGLIETAIGGVDIFYRKEPKITADQYLADGESNPEWEEQGQDLARWNTERAAKLECPPAVVLVWDEFGKMLSVEGDWQRDTRAELLSMYGGRHRGIKTSGKEGIRVPRGKTQMALLATMTSEDLRRGLNVNQATDGLMGRIMFSPDGTSKPPLSRPRAKDWTYEIEKDRLALKIRAFRVRCDARRHVHEGWSAEAEAKWDQWYNHRYKTAVGLEALLFARVQSTGAKIACLLAMAEDSDVVELRHIEVAISMADTSIRVSIDAVNAAVEAQRDRYTDGVVELISSGGEKPLSKVLEHGMLGGKEPGERTVERDLRALWIEKDSRLSVEKGASGKGHKVSLA